MHLKLNLPGSNAPTELLSSELGASPVTETRINIYMFEFVLYTIYLLTEKSRASIICDEIRRSGLGSQPSNIIW